MKPNAAGSARIAKFIARYFDRGLDLRVQAFHLLAFAGMASGLIAALSGCFSGAGALNIALNLIGSCIGAFCFLFARRTGNYRVGFALAVTLTFLILFPLLFFSSGGYRSGMPCFFVFAFVFTALMSEGRARSVFIALELVLYAACMFVAYRVPSLVNHFETEFDALLDTLVGVAVAGGMLVAVMILYIRIYDSRQKQLESLNRMKTEFLQDIGHEIRNPLHVISYGADFIRDRIDAQDGAAEAHSALLAMQNEALRLGRMINGMVELATTRDGGTVRERVDFAALLRRAAETARPLCEQKHNALRVEIPPDLPYVYAAAEQLVRVPVNLLQNAADATENGEIILAAASAGNRVVVRISDNGAGIPPDLLPRVFERGVSGKGGKGYGLSICKTIAEAHGGALEIESEPGAGTSVTLTVPVYGGQSEAREHE